MQNYKNVSNKSLYLLLQSYSKYLNFKIDESLLLENRESKNLSIARRVARQHNSNIDAQELIDSIRHDIPNSRVADCKFLPAVVRMFLTGSLQNFEEISEINKILKHIGNSCVDEFDNDLNGLSYDHMMN